jgi:RNA polymerase sigma-70 factor (ECF subfamily)
MALHKKSISELFPLIQAGDARAFDELFLGYFNRVTAFAGQYISERKAAEEVASDVFVKLWLRRDLLNKVDKPEVYLYVAVKNGALNHLRSAKAKLLPVQEPLTQPEGEQKELQTIIRQAIAALPEQRRLIFTMIKEDGLKSKEVAAILDISVRTVESQLYKAVKFLADRLSSYLGYHPQRQRKRPLLLLNLLLVSIF